MAKIQGKDTKGRQKRVEYKGKHFRASRTGGAALRAEANAHKANVTVNTAKGARVSVRTSSNTRIAFQNRRFQFIGRWIKGPFSANLSKSGISASVKMKSGTLNVLKPQRSSFKFAGIQIRGVNAFVLNLLSGLVFFTCRAIVLLLWVAFLPIAVILDLLSLLFSRQSSS